MKNLALSILAKLIRHPSQSFYLFYTFAVMFHPLGSTQQVSNNGQSQGTPPPTPSFTTAGNYSIHFYFSTTNTLYLHLFLPSITPTLLITNTKDNYGGFLLFCIQLYIYIYIKIFGCLLLCLYLLISFFSKSNILIKSLVLYYLLVSGILISNRCKLSSSLLLFELFL